MLTQKNRTDRKTVEKVFKQGRFVNSANLSLKYIKDSEIDFPQISFTVPKTVCKRAVGRNLLRRRGYAVIRKYFDLVPKNTIGVFVFGKKSLDVFGKKKNKLYNPILNLENEIKEILNKIH